MKPSKLIGPAVLATLAILSVATTTASAATVPNVLPLGTSEKPVTATGQAETTTFGNGILELSSPKATGSGTMNSLKSGSFTASFQEIKSELTGTKCTGLSNGTQGEVTVNGTFHIRDYKSGTELKTASIFLLVPVHFSCAEISVVIAGCVAAALTPENTLTKTLTGTIAKTGADNDIITVLNEENTANELCQLSAKEGTNATKLAHLTVSPTINGFKQSGAAVEVLVMRL